MSYEYIYIMYTVLFVYNVGMYIYIYIYTNIYIYIYKCIYIYIHVVWTTLDSRPCTWMMDDAFTSQELREVLNVTLIITLQPEDGTRELHNVGMCST